MMQLIVQISDLLSFSGAVNPLGEFRITRHVMRETDLIQITRHARFSALDSFLSKFLFMSRV